MAIFAILAAVTVLQAVEAETPPIAALERLRSAAETCIRQNAAEVERSDSNLTDAAAFLTDYFCAREIGAFDNYRANTQLLATMRANGSRGWTLYPPATTGEDRNKQMQDAQAKFAAMYRDASVNPETGALVFAKGAVEGNPYAAMIDQLGDEGIAQPDLFKALAAHAILEARKSRLAH